MKPDGYLLLRAARLFVPILALFALALLASRPAGHGVGLTAGLAFAMAPALHALVFGADRALKAFPPVVAKALLTVGVVVALLSDQAQPAFQVQVGEAGLFLTTVSASVLVIATLFGRAPTLGDGSSW